VQPADGGEASFQPAGGLETRPTPPAPRPAWRLNGWLAAAGWLWLAGAALSYLAALVRIGRFQRLLRCARPASAALQEEARRLAFQMGLARCPPLWLVPGPVPPMVWWGLGRAGLFLPGKLLERLDADGRAAILTHELAHVRRRDHWVRWLELLALGLYWWYPLVWWVRRQIQVHEEACCDAWVVGELPARTYASAILETLDFLAETRPLVPPVASGLGRMHALRWRLTLIMQRRTPKALSAAGWLVVGAAALALLPLRPSLAGPEAQPDAAAGAAEEEKQPAPSAPARAAAPAPEAVLFWPTATDLATADEADAHPVLALALSPDGKLLAVANEDGTVRLLDAAAGHVQHVLIGHADMVACVAFAPDGKTLATGGYDKAVKLWDTVTGKELRTLTGHARWVFGVAFAPDGKTLATGSYDRTVRLWDVAGGTELAVLKGHTAGVRAVAFAPDGKTLASAGVDQTVRLWDPATFAVRSELKGHTGTLRVAAFSPDSKLLATAGEDRTVCLWDVAAGKELTILRGHTKGISALAFSPRGTTLVTGALDGTVKVWDPAEGVERSTLRGHGDAVTGLACTPDGRQLLTGSLDWSLRVWAGIVPLPPAAEAERLQEMERRAGALKAVRISDGTRAPLELAPAPLLRYRDPERAYCEDTLWAWGRKGRPAALLTLMQFPPPSPLPSPPPAGEGKGEGAGGNRPWAYELVSLSDGPLAVEAPDGWKWAPRRSSLELHALPQAPAPADSEAERLRQMEQMVRRFTAAELRGTPSVVYQLRPLPGPLHRYADADAGLLDGGLFAFGYGANPEAILVLEARRRGSAGAAWEYGFVRLSGAELAAGLDERPVWRQPSVQRFTPEDPYAVFTVPAGPARRNTQGTTPPPVRVAVPMPPVKPVVMAERMPDLMGMAVVRLVDQLPDVGPEPPGPPHVVGVMWMPDAQGQMRLTLIMDR
jgi:beta-lactamase regulating signal transducer with metallopeptidase domain